MSKRPTAPAQETQATPVLIDARAVSALTGMPLGSVFDLARANALPFRVIRLGRSVRFNRREVERHLGIDEPAPEPTPAPRKTPRGR